MSVGLLLLTHGTVGEALLAAARGVFGQPPLVAEAVGWSTPDTLDAYAVRAAKALRALDRGDGVLVLSDLYGSTPHNTGERLRHEGVALRRVSGLNLPMLLRLYNYAELGLDDLAHTAAAGARSGIVEGHA